MSEKIKFLIIVCTIVCVGFVVAFLGKLTARRRREALQEKALVWGFEFKEKAKDLLWRLKNFYIFNVWHEKKKMCNHMYGQKDGVRVDIFDYSYMLPGNESSGGGHLTVLLLECDDYISPAFSILPRGGRNNTRHALGRLSVTPVSIIPFSKRYRLGELGEYTKESRVVVSSKLLERIGEYKNLCVEGHENQLLVCRFNRPARIDKDEYESLLSLALELLNLLRSES